MDKEAIIREHYSRLGKIGGSVSTPKKARAARRNAKLATAAVLAGKRKRKQLTLGLR